MSKYQTFWFRRNDTHERIHPSKVYFDEKLQALCTHNKKKSIPVCISSANVSTFELFGMKCEKEE